MTVTPEHRIAVVAMSCRFPGAPDLDAYWELLRQGRSGLSVLTPDQLRAAGVPESRYRHPDYVPVAGLLADPMATDPEALGLSETEAELMDPQQRLFLECSIEALEAAGLGRDGHRGQTSVFAGQALSGYLIDNLGHRFDPCGGADPIDSLHLHGLNVADYLPARVAWQLGLTGPTIAVGATCATSLAAVHLAVNALLDEECDTALAGGVSLRLPQEQGYLGVPDGPFSRDGRTCSYGADASGTVFTQGVGVVVLRRLADALADGDPIRAVVLGSAIGNDGPDRVAFSAPSVDGQARVIAEALAVADVEPQQVELIEGHGTGTRLGDPIEVRALNEVFGPAPAPWCALGSVKSLIGHADSAAGIAGFIKAVLAVEKAWIPSTRHAQDANEDLPLEGSALELAREGRPWTSSQRIAGVSAFGIGGINIHTVIGQAPDRPKVQCTGPRPPLLISAAGPKALEQRTHELTAVAEGELGWGLATSLAHGARQLRWRRAVIGREPSPPVECPSHPARIVMVMPGGGAQCAGMAAGLYAAEPVFARSLDESAELIIRHGGPDPRGFALDPCATDGADPLVGLPSLAAVELACLDLLADAGLEPDVVLGHSLGEYVAAVSAGAMHRRDALLLVVERAKLLSQLPAGAMLSVALGADEATDLLGSHPLLDIAAVNGPQLCAIAGPQPALASLETELRARGTDHRRLRINVAGHSRLVDPVMKPIAELSAGFARPTPHRAMVSTIDGMRVDEPLSPDHWVRHLRSPVRFDLALAEAVRDAEQCFVIQAGPGGSMVHGTAVPARDSVVCWPDRDEVASPEAATAALQRVLAGAWCHGIGIDLDRIVPQGRKAPLPPYPWQRRHLGLPHRRHTGESKERALTEPVPSAEEPLQRPVWRQEPRIRRTEPREGLRIALHGAPCDELRDVLTRQGVIIDEAAELLVHLSDPTDLPALRQEAEAFAAHARRAGRNPVRGLLHITLGAEEVLGTEQVNPFATATTGLARILAQEIGQVAWATVDLDPCEPSWEAVASEIARIGEQASDNSSAQPHRAVRGRRCWSRRWEPWQPPRIPLRKGPATWVITGGMGSVGLALAARVEAEKPQARVVLAGRSLPEPGQPRHDAIAALSRTQVERVDVAEAGALGTLLTRIREEHGSVDVVVHAPVQVDLAPLTELDSTNIDAAFAPKIVGALELSRAVEALPEAPRVLLLSSAAGTIGGFGLGAYVAAGRFLDGIAQTRQWTTLDLDRIRLGTAEESSSAAEVSMRHAIDLTDAVSVILRVTELGVHGQLAASPSGLDARTARLDINRSRGIEREDPVATELSGWEQVVAETWGRVLSRPITSPEDDFFALGGHSLLATRVLAAFRNDHGIDLRLRDLLAAPTVSECAALLDRQSPSGRLPRTGPGQNVPLPETDESRFGLTRVQHAYWLGRTRGLDPSSPVGEGVGCHFYVEYQADGLDIPRYQQAWRTVVQRHPMLRAVITAQGEHRIIELPEDWVPEVVDLSDDAKSDEKLAELRERLSTRVADPARWPLVQPVIVRLDEAHSRVLLSVDVLVCDSASWMIVDRQIRACYLDPEADLGPEPPSFASCLAASRGREEARRESAKRYWTARIEQLPQAPAITSGRSGAGRPRFTRLSARVPAAHWAPLREACRNRRLTPAALVLARYREALARWSGQNHFALTLTVFDRPEVPGIDSVVGEFSTLVLHEARITGSPDPWEEVISTQERIIEDLDHREFGGIEVLAQWSRAHGRTTNIPVVFTSMLGLDALGGENAHDHEWLGPQVHGVSQTPQVWLDHQAFENRGDLVLQWDVCETAVDLADAREQFDAYVASFTTVAPSAVEPSTPSANRGSVRPGDEDTHAHPSPSTSTTGATGSAGSERIHALITAIWAELLGTEPEHIGAGSFLELGGDSLMAVRMASEIRRRTGVTLPLNQIRADITIDELLALLTDGGATTNLTLERRPDSREAFPLLPLQQGYFVGQSGGWHISYPTAHVSTDVGLVLPENIDPQFLEAALQRAADAVAAHQPMVRARVLPDGTQQFRDPDDPRGRTPTRVIDLRGLPDPWAELEGLRRSWALEGPDPRTGPGVSVDAVLLDDRRGRLHVSSSLLIMDGWSASLYDRELFAQLNEPGTVPAPLDIDFGDYVTSVNSQQARAEREVHKQWWWQRIDSLPAAPRLPRRQDTPDRTAPTMTMREFRLDPQDWQQLRTTCLEHGVTPATALLGVFALAIQQLTGQHEMLLNSMQHNRIPVHPDVDRLIGAFSRTALLPLRLPGGTLGETLHRLAEQVEEHNQHHLVTAIDVGREYGRRNATSHPIAPVVFQSTLGMDSALGGELDEQLGPLGRVELNDYHQDIRTPQVELELRFFELRGELIASMASVDELLAEGVPDELLGEVRRGIQQLGDPAAWSMSLPEPRDLASRIPQDTASDRKPAPTGPTTNNRPADPQRLPEITLLWEQLLDLDHRPAPDEDFFGLGGDSLLAIRMLSRLRTEHGIDVAPQDFLLHPSPAGLLALAHESGTGTSGAGHGRAVGKPSDSLFKLRGGTGRPMFLLHPSGGDITCYTELARHLRTTRPVMAIADPGLDGHPIPTTIDGMVDLYRELITDAQPQGPWTLGGWSMGGTMAHELARRITCDGGTVDALVMIDSNSPDRIIRLANLSATDREDAQRLRHLRSIEAFLGLDVGPRDDWRALIRELVDRGVVPDPELLELRFPVFRRHMEALAGHTAGPLDPRVPVLLLRAGQRSPRNSGEGMGVDDIDEPELGWSPWIRGPFTTKEMDAHHYSIIRPPAVVRVAEEVSCFLSGSSGSRPSRNR